MNGPRLPVCTVRDDRGRLLAQWLDLWPGGTVPGWLVLDLATHDAGEAVGLALWVLHGRDFGRGTSWDRERAWDPTHPLDQMPVFTFDQLNLGGRPARA